MKNKKIYISGKISGFDLAYIYFDYAERLLKQNYIVINPFKIKNETAQFLNSQNSKLCQTIAWWLYMIKDIYYLLDCDNVYMLSNWKESKGAKIEHAIAKFLKKKIIYE
jgi:hypothetical protein